MADVKNLLKEARKLIDEKNYKEAQECCKNILRKDKQNYLGLVLLGKSLQDTDQAPLAFQKAIACKRDHPLGWQGLANYYETKDGLDAKIKLLSVYDGMLKIPLEEDKIIEVLTKLGQLGCRLKSPQALSILIKFIANKPEAQLVNAGGKQLIELLKCEVPHSKEYLPLLLNSLNIIYENNPGNTDIELFIAKIICCNSDRSSVIQEIINLPFFTSNTAVRKWICQYLFSLYVQQESFCEVDVGSIYNILTEDIGDYKYTALLQSVLSYQKGAFFDAYKQCIPVINYQHPDNLEAIYVIKCTAMLKDWSMTYKLAYNFLTKVNDEGFAIELRKYLFLSLVKQQKWTEAMSVIKKGLDVDSFTPEELASLTECYIEVGESTNHLFERLLATDYYIPLQALALIRNSKYTDTVALLDNSICENPIKYFFLGVAHWELKQYEKCHVSLLKAAKLDPSHGYTFLYLGHCYRDYLNDLEKARKCYERALNIKPFDGCIAKNLSEIYAKLGLRHLDYELLKSLENSELKDNSWVNFRFGLHLLNKRLWEKAIVKFRNVIKMDSNDSTALECLADAYYGRGSYTSALRAYDKVMSLNPNKVSHCQTKIGFIYSLLTQYEQAISTFEQVLKLNPQSILTLKGIAEAWMRVAQKRFAFKMYGIARDCAQNAVDYIIRAINKEKKFSCLWKLLADTLIFLTKLPSTYAYVYIENLFDEKKGDQEKKEKLDIFPYVIACYMHIMKYKKETSSYDLALVYLMLYRESHELTHSSISFNLTLSCVKKKPSAWRNWNLLGKLCLQIKKYNFAQHCFIKALLVTRKWSVAKIWCNLGTLYLKLKMYKLANYCFWRGQSTLPSYPQSWIGQALIAEVIREEEAMDLFRHASRLGYHRESALGYGDWVCRTLKSSNINNPEFKYIIDGLYAVPYAIDLIQWYCCYETNDACAYTVLGILQERYGLIQPAFKSYEKALLNVVVDKKNIALLNMGRILLRLQQYDKAIITFKAITEATLDSTCGLALALFKNNEYEEAYAVYDTALHWLSNDDNEKADVLVAMSGIVYLFKGADDARTILFQSIQVSQNKPTPHTLFAICSLGILHSNESLSKLALSELRNYERDVKFNYDIGFLKSYILVCNEKMEEAIKSISDSIHDHPDSAPLWFCMAQYCLRSSHAKVKAASSCAQRAMCSSHHCTSDDKTYKMLATASVAEHLAGNNYLGLSLAKKGLHMYPQQSEIWAALVFSLLPNEVFTEKKSWLTAAAGHMRRHLDISRSLSRWVGLVENKLSK